MKRGNRIKVRFSSQKECYKGCGAGGIQRNMEGGRMWRKGIKKGWRVGGGRRDVGMRKKGMEGSLYYSQGDSNKFHLCRTKEEPGW